VLTATAHTTPTAQPATTSVGQWTPSSRRDSPMAIEMATAVMTRSARGNGRRSTTTESTIPIARYSDMLLPE
jgi:hypothetical protein